MVWTICFLWGNGNIYALNHYLDLTYFLISWSSYKNFQFVPLIGPNKTPPSVWRLDPRGIRLRWKNQWERRPYNSYHDVCEMDCLQIVHQHISLCQENVIVGFLSQSYNQKNHNPNSEPQEHKTNNNFNLPQ